ncbi:hypothetical protein EVA_05031 [gut metagenome]|uniref:Uncharacterized protein n=1 Tax=gut metagenome TaxID=749906 RepID=J9GIA6_9ZZZZ
MKPIVWAAVPVRCRATSWRTPSAMLFPMCYSCLLLHTEAKVITSAGCFS